MRRLVILLLCGGCRQLFEIGIPALAADASPATIDSPDAPPDAGMPCAADTDGDGVCDKVDDWPCGAKPTSPPTHVTIAANNALTLLDTSNVQINHGPRMAVISMADTALDLTLGYMYFDMSCPGNCLDQIEVGFVAGTRVGCVFDAFVPKSTGISGSADKMIAYPTAPGVYDLRINIGQAFACGSGAGWFGGAGFIPPVDATIARICVTP